MNLSDDFLSVPGKTMARIASVVLVSGCLVVALPALAQPPSDPAFASGRILLLPRAGLSDLEVDKAAKSAGAIQSRRVGNSQLRIVDVPPGIEKQSVEKLARHPHMKFAELDIRFPAAMQPNDPYFGSEWHLAKIGTTSAWNLATGSGVIVAVLDTGVDATHPELSGNVLPGWNFFGNNSDTSDTRGHGTAVAGTIAAATNNGIGVASIAGGARILPLRVSDDSGYAYSSAIAQAITYAADKGARVASVSFENLPSSTAVQNAAQYMKSKNGLVVVAAGNTASGQNWKATSSMIPVSATDRDDKLTSFSSWGDYVSVSAPGVDIWTTRAGGTYWYCWGTSFSTPVTAGVVALMMSVNPTLTSTEIEALLFATATDLGTAGRDPQYGYGRVNAAAAVPAARDAVSTADTTAPAVAIAAPLVSSTVSGVVAVDVSASDNVGVARVELRANGSLVATDSAAPFAFSWDSKSFPNGMVNLTAVAVDAAGNAATSATVAVNVANVVVVDTVAPVVAITSPTSGATVSGTVAIRVSATDNSGSAGITNTLYVDGKLVATATGGSLGYSWNTRKVAAGLHTIRAEARDKAGNTTSTTTQVYR